MDNNESVISCGHWPKSTHPAVLRSGRILLRTRRKSMNNHHPSANDSSTTMRGCMPLTNRRRIIRIICKQSLRGYRAALRGHKATLRGRNPALRTGKLLCDRLGRGGPGRRHGFRGAVRGRHGALGHTEKLVRDRRGLFWRERERGLEGRGGDRLGRGHMPTKLEPDVTVVAVDMDGIGFADEDRNDSHSLWCRHSVRASSASEEMDSKVTQVGRAVPSAPGRGAGMFDHLTDAVRRQRLKRS